MRTPPTKSCPLSGLASFSPSQPSAATRAADQQLHRAGGAMGMGVDTPRPCTVHTLPDGMSDRTVTKSVGLGPQRPFSPMDNLPPESKALGTGE